MSCSIVYVQLFCTSNFQHAACNVTTCNKTVIPKINICNFKTCSYALLMDVANEMYETKLQPPKFK